MTVLTTVDIDRIRSGWNTRSKSQRQCCWNNNHWPYYIDASLHNTRKEVAIRNDTVYKTHGNSNGIRGFKGEFYDSISVSCIKK